MKILSIEPTPSPHSMKLTMDESLPAGSRATYSSGHPENEDAPAYIRRLLQIEGIRQIFHTADFLAIERDPKAPWQPILAQAREVLGEAEPDEGTANASENKAVEAGPAAKGGESGAAYGEAQVLVQLFLGIPMQVRVQTEGQEARLAMPQRFTDAVFQAQKRSGGNLIMQRHLADFGVRYGNLQEIAEQIVQELDASYDDARLAELVQAAGKAVQDASEPSDAAGNVAAEDLDTQTILFDPDWKKRYAAFNKLTPDRESLPLIVKALKDSHFSIRRLAVVYLGDIRDPEVYPYLYQALLEDKNPSVRRTAGDCLSDIGDPDAIPAMCQAITDPHKIVRWRAARFLYEQGDKTAVLALKAAVKDPEFEVSMQARIALQRIAEGEAAVGSVWQQMTRRDRS